jgi:AraC-like DNA-binding protein
MEPRDGHLNAVSTLSTDMYSGEYTSPPSPVANIGFTVGYDSPSQFSRDYGRLIGSPPAREAARLRTFSSAGALPFSQPLWTSGQVKPIICVARGRPDRQRSNRFRLR